LTTLSLTHALYNAIVAHASACPDAEVCGFVAGKNGTCTSAYPVTNVSPTPQCTYFMDPYGQNSAMSIMAERGETLIAQYHSHPRKPAHPSKRDIDGARQPQVAHLIVSLADSRRPRLAAFKIVGNEYTAMRVQLTSAQ